MALIQAASNFLVPAMGATSMWSEKMILTANPQQIDFAEKANDGVPFSPYGVWVDNSKGTKEAEIVIQATGMSIRCPAGEFIATSFPAPFNLVVNVTGEGECVLIFVDSPVMPVNMGGGGGTINIPVPLPTTGPLTNSELRSSPVEIAFPVQTALTPEISVATTSDVVTSGAVSASFKNIGTTNVIVLGSQLEPGDIVTFTAPDRYVLAAIPFDATGGQLQISTLR